MKNKPTVFTNTWANPNIIPLPNIAGFPLQPYAYRIVTYRSIFFCVEVISSTLVLGVYPSVYIKLLFVKTMGLLLDNRSDE